MIARFRSLLLLVLGLGSVLSAAAQYTGVTATSTPGLNVRRPLTTDQSILYPPQRDQTLLPGDLITVTVFGVTPGYADVERVSLDGTVRLPLAGKVVLGHLTISQAEERLSQFFEEKELFHDAQVNLVITEAPNHVVTLTGTVQREIQIVGQRTLLDVLSLAGGLPQNASTVIQIDRPGLAEPILVDLGNNPATSTVANIPIFSGDIITTGDVGQFFIIGAVGSPGNRPLVGARPLTVLQAVTAAGGMTSVARPKDARLVRTVGNTRSVIPLNLSLIQKGEAPDPVLQAEDILMVPTSKWKSYLRLQNATSVLAIALALVSISRY